MIQIQTRKQGTEKWRNLNTKDDTILVLLDMADADSPTGMRNRLCEHMRQVALSHPTTEYRLLRQDGVLWSSQTVQPS